MKYKVLIPFTLQREHNKGEILTEQELTGFAALYLANGSISEAEENPKKEELKEPEAPKAPEKTEENPKKPNQR